MQTLLTVGALPRRERSVELRPGLILLGLHLALASLPLALVALAIGLDDPLGFGLFLIAAAPPAALIPAYADVAEVPGGDLLVFVLLAYGLALGLTPALVYLAAGELVGLGPIALTLGAGLVAPAVLARVLHPQIARIPQRVRRGLVNSTRGRHLLRPRRRALRRPRFRRPDRADARRGAGRARRAVGGRVGRSPRGSRRRSSKTEAPFAVAFKNVALAAAVGGSLVRRGRRAAPVSSRSRSRSCYFLFLAQRRARQVCRSVGNTNRNRPERAGPQPGEGWAWRKQSRRVARRPLDDRRYRPRGEHYAPEPPSHHLPPMGYADMPEPLPLRKILGPSVILAGLGVGSGEYILWPYITTNVGLGFLWAAVVGVTIQYFLNMEIERYTLATGETAVAGFARFWKPWGILFCVFTIVPNMWPGWGTAGATIFTYLVGGNPNVIAIILLLSIGVALTASPVVYQTLEKAEFFKVGLTIVFLIIAVFAAIKASAWADLPDAVSGFGKIPSDEVAIATILAGLVFAGAGGANNLVQSNWIRDKGFGMGEYVPHIVSPITGEDQAAPSTGTMVRQDEANIGRFNGWFKQASKEQLVSFWAICVGSIIVFSVLAYSTVFGQNLSDEADFDFIKGEGDVAQGRRGALVRDAVLGLRRALARARGARRGRLRLAARRRRDQDAVRGGQRALEREQDLLPRWSGAWSPSASPSCSRASTSRSCCSCCRPA